jgi:hypothetical protein
VHLLHGLELHQPLDRPVDHRVQPFDAGQRHVKFIELEDFYEFASLFVARRWFPGQQAFGYFGAPFLRVVTGLEWPFTADRGAVEGDEGGEHGLNLLHGGGFAKIKSPRAKIINVVAVLVYLANPTRSRFCRD